MPIEIRELVLKATVRTTRDETKVDYITKADLYEFERQFKRNLKRQIQKEIRSFSRRR